MKRLSDKKFKKVNLLFLLRCSVILISIIVLQAPFAKTTGSGIPNDFKLYENSINAQIIKFDVPAVSNLKITVFDKNGGIVKGYLYDNIEPGTHELNISDLDKGDYTYKMTAGDYSQTYSMSVSK